MSRYNDFQLIKSCSTNPKLVKRYQSVPKSKAMQNTYLLNHDFIRLNQLKSLWVMTSLTREHSSSKIKDEQGLIRDSSSKELYRYRRNSSHSSNLCLLIFRAVIRQRNFVYLSPICKRFWYKDLRKEVSVSTTLNQWYPCYGKFTEHK